MTQVASQKTDFKPFSSFLLLLRGSPGGAAQTSELDTVFLPPEPHKGTVASCARGLGAQPRGLIPAPDVLCPSMGCWQGQN